ncbi:MAG TPA: DUF4190 domain-containing protein [Gaiellales bacterium]|jgi:hypothetical protein|nr:DUF4190 domain-containing protein [Gaiellales bacterium]
MPERAAASLPWPPGKSAPVELCTCCGEPLAAGTDVCPKCNTDVRGGTRSQAARGSLLLGLLGLAVLPIIFSIPAIVLALRARREIARTPGLHGSDAAGWGLATGIMGTVLGIFLILTVVLGIAAPS